MPIGPSTTKFNHTFTNPLSALIVKNDVRNLWRDTDTAEKSRIDDLLKFEEEWDKWSTAHTGSLTITNDKHLYIEWGNNPFALTSPADDAEVDAVLSWACRKKKSLAPP